MKKLQRIISMILAVTITVASSGITGIKVMADEEKYVTMITNKQTINAGTKELSGLVAEKGDTTNLSKNLINFLDENTTISEQNAVNGNICSQEEDIYYKGKIDYSCSQISLKNEIVANSGIAFYVDKLNTTGETYLYTKEGDITINASTVVYKGIIYAPNGNVVINVGEIDFTGVIIANEITINAGTVKIKEDKDIAEYVENMLMFANESYMDFMGIMFEESYDVQIKCDKELESVDVYVRYDDKGSFEKYTTIYEKETSITGLTFEGTVDIIAVGYTKFGEKISSNVESYGIDEDGNYYYFKKDTDGDGIADGIELWYLGSNINSIDSDNDGFGDYYEVFVLGTNPTVYTEDKDSDSDGINDKVEMNINSNPYLKDTDFDGIIDGADANPVSYDIGYEKTEYEYNIVDTIFDISKIYKDDEGNMYIHVYNYIQGIDKAVLGTDKNMVLFYDNAGKMITKLTETNGIFDINTYEYIDNKVSAISNNGYKYSIVYKDDNVDEIYLNNAKLFDYEYDSVNQLVGEKRGDDAGYTYEYDENGLLKVKNAPDGRSFTYEYDEYGNVRTITDAQGENTVIYTYGEEGIDEIKFGDDFVISYYADDNTLSTKYTLKDEEKELICTKDEGDNIETLLITGDILVSSTEEKETPFSYEYDKNNRITKVLENGIIIKEYKYNGFGQITKEIDYLENCTYENDYKYDNIIARRVYQNEVLVEENNYVYDSMWSDKLTSVEAKEVVYDNNGSITEYGENTYTWKGNLLTSFENSEHNVSYKYNDEGIRESKTVDGVETKYYYDGEMLVAEKTGENIVWYVYNMEQEVIGFIYIDCTYYYEKNLTGDIVKIVDENNEMVVKYNYDAWGNIISVTGNEELIEVNPFTYKGYYRDNETGMYYLTTRYYDSSLCRFISIDGVNAILNSYENYNLYAYCCNDPVNKFDPEGTEAVNVLLLFDKNLYYGEYNDNMSNFFFSARRYVDKVGGKATCLLITKESFISNWNNLRYDGKNIVVGGFHGSPTSISIGGEKITISEIQNLYVAKIDLLILFSCNAAHDNYRDRNIAYAFFNKIANKVNGVNKSMVLASDGTVVAEPEGALTSIYDTKWESYTTIYRKKYHGWILYRHGYSSMFVDYYKSGNTCEKVLNGVTYVNCEYIFFEEAVPHIISTYALTITNTYK